MGRGVIRNNVEHIEFLFTLNIYFHFNYLHIQNTLY